MQEQLEIISGKKATGYKWIFFVATFIHFIWGLIVFRSIEALYTTPTFVLGLIINNHTILGLVLMLISICSIIGYLQKTSNIKHIILLVPQQVTLCISAFGALYMVMSGHYADGVPRSTDFMLVDQLPIISIALCHFLALFEEQGQIVINKMRSIWESI